jgi:hypothetical protein
MRFFLVLGLFREYLHRKLRLGPTFHQFSLCLTRSGSFFLHMQDRYKCYPMHANMPRAGELDIAFMDLPPHLYTYARDTCKFLWDSGSRQSFSKETLVSGPRRSTPIDFSIWGVTNVPFPWLKFVSAIAKWKSKVGRQDLNLFGIVSEGDWKAMWWGLVSMAELLDDVCRHCCCYDDGEATPRRSFCGHGRRIATPTTLIFGHRRSFDRRFLYVFP